MHTPRLKTFFTSTTSRLAWSYLAIIMLMSLGFSVVFYKASSHELGRQVPPPSSFGMQSYDDYNGTGPRLDEFFEQRIAEGKHTLLERLLILNGLALIGGAVFSYYLARRTMAPIKANMEAQTQFVSDASHELRTPLAVLQTTNEVALRRHRMSAAETKDLLAHNVEEVVKLRLLTDSLLRLAKQDGGNLKFAPVSLADITADALNAIVERALAKKIRIDDSLPKIMVRADKPSLTQAVVTVLDNAVKYSPAKSTITVMGETQGKWALLHVTDQGPGITPKDLPHIFDRFYRADEARTGHAEHSYGIGLALAKKIIEQHHGEIIATSHVGQGATFTVKLRQDHSSKK